MNENGRKHMGFFVLFGLVAVVVFIFAAFALFRYAGPMPMRGYYFWPIFPFGFIGFFIVLFLIFGVLRWAFWGWGWRRGGYYGGYYADPKLILKRRYARGEITKEQFEQMMRDLELHA